MNERFGYSRKEKREIRDNVQNYVARDSSNKIKAANSEVIDRYDKAIFSQGEAWFNLGLSIEDAPEEKKKNSNFKKGFERAKRISEIENSLYLLGISYYEDGLSVDEIPVAYKHNSNVLRGYNDAKNKRIGSK